MSAARRRKVTAPVARDHVQTHLYPEELKLAPATSQGEVTILPPQDVFATLSGITEPVTTTILDPWYNKGFGGTRPDYSPWLYRVLDATAQVSQHIFLWGFPEIIYPVPDHLPKGFALIAWLTWYYKNCPSVIRGWRSAQLACLHIARPETKLYPEHFLTEAQLELQRQHKLRYMPGPPSVIETSLLVGFVGRNEQTGHPSQKPIKSIEPLVLMTTKPGDTVLDPMCGSGTTGVVCRSLGRNAILCDESEQYTRLGVCRRTSFWRRATTTGCGHALDGCQQVVGRARRAGVFRQTPSRNPPWHCPSTSCLRSRASPRCRPPPRSPGP